MNGWTDVEDHGEPELRAEWKMAADDPPIESASTVTIPAELLEIEHTPGQ